MAYKSSPKQFLILWCFVVVYFVQSITCASLQPGIFELDLTKTGLEVAMKSLFAHTVVRVAVDSKKDNAGDGTVKLSWELRYTQCEGLYGMQLSQSAVYEDVLYRDHSYMFPVEHYINVAVNESYDITLDGSETPLEMAFQNYTTIDWNCYVSNTNISFGFRGCSQDLTTSVTAGTGTSKDDEGGAAKPDNGGEAAAPDDEGGAAKPDNGGEAAAPKSRRKRADPPPAGGGKPEDQPAGGEKPKDQGKGKDMMKDGEKLGKELVKVPSSGSYLLIMKLEVVKGNVPSFPVKVYFKGEHGYLSAFQYKLLPFYGIMCGLYMLMGFTWLFLMCYQYKDLLGIQIWIGVVILLGLVEKAVFFGEYEHMNNYGTESSLGILFPEIVSCIKRTLARLLVVVVSIGYGITRPRLGNDLNYIMAAGLTYLLLSSAEAIMRTNQNYERTMVAVLPLSILDAILVWWIFRNLVDTSRVLRLRQNDTKLWLYRHFTNTLLLCVLLSVIFFIWSMKTHSMNECIIQWEELWLDDAFWHILFCVILSVIMILFRPSINNQRYAYSPLVDDGQEGDEESKEPMLTDAYDGMKMRNLKKDNPQNAVMDIADDLKWVEDNIPAAIADTALTMMDDSEDELMADTERSKMD